MSTFTPGPWSIVPYGDGSSLVIHSDSDNRVCFMATASSDRPTSHAAIRANAALIAAAPALYEALKQISLFAGPTLPRYENALNIIRDMQYVARAALSRTSP